MKKYMIIMFTLMLNVGLFCELDYQLQSEFGFGGILKLQYSNDTIYSVTGYGPVIYEIQANGDLDNISNVRDIPGWGKDYYSHGKLADYDGYVNSDDPDNYPSYFSIYDLSVPNEQSLLYEIQIDSSNMLSAELFENYFIRKTGSYQYTVFDYDNFQAVSQVDNITLVYSSKFNDMGAILLDYSDNCYYYYIIDETGTLQRKYNLGQEERKIAISGDKIISYSWGDIRLYNITESDSLEYTGTTYFNSGIMRSLVFENNKIIFTSEEVGDTAILMLKMLVFDEENNFTLLDTKQLDERPSLTGVPGSSLILKNNSLYISLDQIKLTQANITNNGIEMLDVNYIERGRSSLHGFIKNNKFYTMCFEINTNLHSYSLENYTNVQQVDNDFPEKSAYWYFQEEEKIVRFDEILECFYFYDWEDDNLILTDSYNLEGFVDTSFLTPFKWDGNQFIYRIDSSLISVIKENGEFIESWVLNGSLTYNYEIYQNYIYQLRSNQGIKVYSFNESEYQLVNNITTPFIGLFPTIFIRGDILTANEKNIIDLSYDPVGLSMRYDLNHYHVNSGAVKYYDYLMYCGTANYDTQYGYDYRNRLLSIFKLIDNIPVEVGVITSDYSVHDLLIIEGGTEDNFDILVSNTNFFSIYSCQATPTGQLEITPVTLNALNYPNPFNPETTISYNIEQAGSVSIDVYNLKGQKVKGLVNEKQEAGKHSIIWQGDNDKGQPVSSGTYFYRVKSADQEIVKKMLLMK